MPPNAATGPENPLDRMKRDIDPYGRTRFIESEHDNGKPRIWYQSAPTRTDAARE